MLRAAFLGVRGATSVRQEMLERAEQEASEASARRVGLVKEIPLKTEGEEVLDKVLGLLLAAAGAPGAGPVTRLCPHGGFLTVAAMLLRLARQLTAVVGGRSFGS